MNSSGPEQTSLVAAEHGYTDQAHLIHDFRDLTGSTPTSYRHPLRNGATMCRSLRFAPDAFLQYKRTGARYRDDEE
jgi:hypothetical protein